MPLHVALIWHMHQPYYRQPGSDVAVLPWTRLHATKDYLHMAQVVERFPGVHVTFTLAPSLAEQLQDYTAGKLQDRLMILARQPYFSPDDKRYLLNLCFSIQWDNIIRRHPPYAALLDRRHLALLNPDYFSEQTYRDLIVWFNLAWTDPNLLEHDPLLARLVSKGKDFSLGEAAALIERHLEITGEVLTTYRRLQDNGQIEVITIPYFHPILPLLIDSSVAHLPSPGAAVPDPPFSFPQDANAQIASGVRLYSELMGRPPVGMWPSEGAVSPAVAALAAKNGIRWLATDEAILGRSLDVYFHRDAGDFIQRPDILYRPYRLAIPASGDEEGAAAEVQLVFRDHNLSDRIGFTYKSLGGHQAAEDMIVRLKHIAHQLRRQRHPGLVSIILDGENCWEHYEHNGDVFLHALYGRLESDPDLRAVTVSEHLAAFPPDDTLPELAAGSWIRGDFSTWIGDPEHTEAWSRLRDLRTNFEAWLSGNPSPDQIQLAQHALFAAEGSDWYWWYSWRNSSDQDALFDQTFLDYLATGYRALGQEPPPGALTPIQGINQRPPQRPTFLSPRLNADPDPGAHWSSAFVLRPAASTGAMQQAGGAIQYLRVGNDATFLYLRAELSAPIAERRIEIDCRTVAGDYVISLSRGGTSFLYRRVDGSYAGQGPVTYSYGPNFVEVAVPLARLGLVQLGSSSFVGLVLRLDPGESGAEQMPPTGEHIVPLAFEPPGH